MDFNFYHQQIFDFVNTLTIKFDLLSYCYKNILHRDSGYAINRPEDNPYYLNLAGMYHPLDTPMYVNCIETGEQILFSLENLKKYPDTGALYKINGPEYKTLMQRYPEQVGLIKQIAYPVEGGLNRIIDADDLTLLSYDSSMLEAGESADLIRATEDFLTFYKKRWHTKMFYYEDLYAPATYALMWNGLVNHLFTRRIQNIKTDKVHSYHIWQYLENKGLGNYSTILSRKQTLFLYRNIDYILKNKGKGSNLKILAENLLAEMNLHINQKVVNQQTYTLAEDCETIPEVTSENILYPEYEDRQAKIESVDTLMKAIKASKLDPDMTDGDVAKTELKLSRLPQSKTLTRVLELKKLPISTRYLDLMSKFLMDSLIFNLSIGNLAYRIKWVHKDSGILMDTSAKELTTLFIYAAYKSIGQDYIRAPETYRCNLCYRRFKPVNIPKIVHVAGRHVPIASFVDVNKVVDDIPFYKGPFTSQEDFNDSLCIQFPVFAKHHMMTRLGKSLGYMEGMGIVYKECLVDEVIEYSFFDSTERTYEEWFGNHPNMRLVRDYCDSSPDSKSAWDQIAVHVLKTLLPFDDMRLRRFSGIDPNSDLYNKLKDLFVRLCSYTICFTDTTSEKFNYFYKSVMGQELYKSHAISKEYYRLFSGLSIWTSQKVNVTDQAPPLGKIMDKCISNAASDVSFEKNLKYKTDQIRCHETAVSRFDYNNSTLKSPSAVSLHTWSKTSFTVEEKEMS